jgi:3,4-dihydroxy 2-butanone 4-phosphate synthase/GTP cyclohydrolase II
VGVIEPTPRWTLDAALRRVAEDGSGVVVVLRGAESPRDLADAVLEAPAGEGGADANAVAPVWRTYGIGAQILRDLGLRRMRVLSSPKQMLGLAAFGLEVDEYIAPGTESIDAP